MSKKVRGNRMPRDFFVNRKLISGSLTKNMGSIWLCIPMQEPKEEHSEGRSIPSVILEFGFHDNPLEADFFIKNESLLAETVGNVLVEFYGLVRR